MFHFQRKNKTPVIFNNRHPAMSQKWMSKTDTPCRPKMKKKDKNCAFCIFVKVSYFIAKCEKKSKQSRKMPQNIILAHTFEKVYISECTANERINYRYTDWCERNAFVWTTCPRLLPESEIKIVNSWTMQRPWLRVTRPEASPWVVWGGHVHPTLQERFMKIRWV